MTSKTIHPEDERVSDIVDLLTERRKFRYAGNCKCGNCQLVPLEMLGRAIDTLRHQREEIGRLREALMEIATIKDFGSYNPEMVLRLKARSALSDTTREK